jgi:predicted nucleotidyltransferase
MYSTEERKSYLDRTVELVKSSDLVEGIIQIGSGVIGFNDEHSDIDFIIATSEKGNY